MKANQNQAKQKQHAYWQQSRRAGHCRRNENRGDCQQDRQRNQPANSPLNTNHHL